MRQNQTNEIDEYGEAVESKGERTNLTPRQDRAIRALLTSRTIDQAAKRAAVSPRSISRWLRQDENFQDELSAARRQLLAQATVRLQQMAAGAIDVLDKVIQDDQSSSASKVSGVRTALDFAYRALELEDIEERLAAVERRLAEGPPAEPPVSVKWVELHDDDYEQQQEPDL